jgi:GGDEF domain-containing protein
MTNGADSPNEVTPNSERELLQKAIECYLSTIVAFADCIADICPHIGVPFRNQWRRLPQRIGFDSSPESLERSRRTFQGSLDSLRELARAYFGEGLPAMQMIGEKGRGVVDLVLERNAACSVQMATLADSLAAAADLDAPPELRDQLEHQAAGLRAGAKRVETEILPSLAELQRLIDTCSDLIHRTQETSVVDLETGFLNAYGFLRELNHQLSQGPACVVTVDLAAVDQNSKVVPPERFQGVHSSMAQRIAEQFRALDSVGRLGDGRFAVLFAGTPEQAKGRQQSITRGISGIYSGPEGKLKVRAELHIHQIQTTGDADALIGTPGKPVTQLQA